MCRVCSILAKKLVAHSDRWLHTDTRETDADILKIAAVVRSQ